MDGEQGGRRWGRGARGWMGTSAVQWCTCSGERLRVHLEVWVAYTPPPVILLLPSELEVQIITVILVLWLCGCNAHGGRRLRWQDASDQTTSTAPTHRCVVLQGFTR
jgi:hypothetical protein